MRAIILFLIAFPALSQIAPGSYVHTWDEDCQLIIDWIKLKQDNTYSAKLIHMDSDSIHAKRWLILREANGKWYQQLDSLYLIEDSSENNLKLNLETGVQEHEKYLFDTICCPISNQSFKINLSYLWQPDKESNYVTFTFNDNSISLSSNQYKDALKTIALQSNENILFDKNTLNDVTKISGIEADIAHWLLLKSSWKNSQRPYFINGVSIPSCQKATRNLADDLGKFGLFLSLSEQAREVIILAMANIEIAREKVAEIKKISVDQDRKQISIACDEVDNDLQQYNTNLISEIGTVIANNGLENLNNISTLAQLLKLFSKSMSNWVGGFLVGLNLGVEWAKVYTKDIFNEPVASLDIGNTIKGTLKEIPICSKSTQAQKNHYIELYRLVCYSYFSSCSAPLKMINDSWVWQFTILITGNQKTVSDFQNMASQYKNQYDYAASAFIPPYPINNVINVAKRNILTDLN